MSITFSRAYVANGKAYATLEEAQRAAIKELAPGSASMTVEDWTALLVDNKNAIVDILTLNDQSRPKARGTKKPRKTKPAVERTAELISADQ